jgi:uncharacterized membrane protein
VVGAVAAGLVPGIGPLVAAGILATTAAGAAVGATVGGLVGSLSSLGLSDEDAGLCAAEFDSGSPIVVVKADETERASALLRAEGPRPDIGIVLWTNLE